MLGLLGLLCSINVCLVLVHRFAGFAGFYLCVVGFWFVDLLGLLGLLGSFLVYTAVGAEVCWGCEVCWVRCVLTMIGWFLVLSFLGLVGFTGSVVC